MRNEILEIIWKRSVDGKIDHSSYGDMADELAEMVAKNLHKPPVSGSLPEDATTCLTCGEFEPYCKCVNGYKRQ